MDLETFSNLSPPEENIATQIRAPSESGVNVSCRSKTLSKGSNRKQHGQAVCITDHNFLRRRDQCIKFDTGDN